MQIQEVSNRTGLTKRTIRFYIEKELIDPAVVERNGKEYREYSEKDIRLLQTLAELRKAMFSIEQIKEMLDEPVRIPAVLGDYREELTESHKNITRLMGVMEGLDAGKVKDIYVLSAAVSDVSKEMSLPALDITPHFARFDKEYGQAGELSMPRVHYLSKWFAVFMTSMIMVVGCVCMILYNNRTLNPEFAGDAYHLLSYTAEEGARYISKDGKTVSVYSPGQISKAFVRGLGEPAYYKYSIKVVDAGGTLRSYEYRPTNSFEVWIVGKYDLYGFTLPASFVVDGETMLIENYESIPEDVLFIINVITAYRNYVPIYRAFIPLYIAIPIVLFLWFVVISWWNSRRSKQVLPAGGLFIE